MGEAEPRTRSNPWIKLAVRVCCYVAAIMALLYWRGYGSPSSHDAPLPKVQGAARKDAAEATDPTFDLETFYPRRTLLAWDVTTDSGGKQTVSVLVKLEGNLQRLAWNELKLRRTDTSDNLAEPVPEPPTGKPLPGLVLLNFALPAGQTPFTTGVVWCWDRVFCKLLPERRRPKAKLEELLRENRARMRPDVASGPSPHNTEKQ